MTTQPRRRKGRPRPVVANEFIALAGREVPRLLREGPASVAWCISATGERAGTH